MREFLFLIMFLSTPVSAQELSCNAQNLCTIYRPVRNETGNIVSLPYSFKYRPAKGGNPTVVMIPGGPGGGVAGENPETFKTIPKDYGLILTDPRFVGANKIKDAVKFKSEFTSQGVADDILRAVHAVKAKDYIVYGQSYGTVVATELAARAGVQDQPRAVILEGTLGHAANKHEYQIAFHAIWNSLVASIQPAVFQQFQNHVKDFIQNDGVKSSEMGTVLQILMMSRHASDGSDNLFNFVGTVALNPKKGLAAFRAINDQINKAIGEKDSSLFHDLISCTEIFPDMEQGGGTDFSYDGSTQQLQAGAPGKSCESLFGSLNKHLYDAKEFQVKAPIIYLQGGGDPATPEQQAEYHANVQKLSKDKHFVLVPNASHEVLDTDLSACSGNFWLSLKVSAQAASDVLSPCINKGFSLDDLFNEAATTK